MMIYIFDMRKKRECEEFDDHKCLAIKQKSRKKTSEQTKHSCV